MMAAAESFVRSSVLLLRTMARTYVIELGRVSLGWRLLSWGWKFILIHGDFLASVEGFPLYRIASTIFGLLIPEI